MNSGESRRHARQGWAFLRAAMSGHWGALGTSTAAALTWSAIVAFIPLLLGEAVNEGLLQHRWRRFALYVGIIAVLGVLQACCSGARRWWNGVASRRVESEVRRQFHDHLLSLDVAYHDSVNRGQLLSRVTSDLFQIQAVVASAPYWVGSGALAGAVAVIMLVESPLLAAAAICALPLVAVTSQRFSRRVRSAIADLQRERGALAGVVEETISGVRAVKGLGAEPVMDRHLATSADAVLTEAMRVVRTRARYLPTLNTVPMFELAAVNWLGGYLVLQHRLSVGLLVAFNAYLAVLTGPLQSVGAYIVMLQRAVVSGYRLDAILRRRTAVPEPAKPASLPPGPGRVVFSSVRFSYPPGAKGRQHRAAESGVAPSAAPGPPSRPVLQDLDLVIEGGEIVALVGATGSGKTTILSLMARLYDPTAGSVSIDGVNVADLSLSDLRQAVGVVFEESFLFNESIEANMLVGRPDATADQLADAAHLAQADEFIDELPLGYGTVVGERGLSLSGGQRQRLALARALLAGPRVLVLDDATSAVDAARELEVVAAVARARHGQTTIIISHRPATIAFADRTVFVEGGRVLAQGTHDELLSTSPEYRRVLALDLEQEQRGTDQETADQETVDQETVDQETVDQETVEAVNQGGPGPGRCSA